MDFLSRLHRELRMARYTRRGATHDPKDVPEGVHKEYRRMRCVTLPAPEELTMPLPEILQTRHSMQTSTPEIPLSLKDYGTLFGLALRRREGVINRNYPSAGGLYPIETYLFTKKIENEKGGVFHYHPTAHALEKLWDLPQGCDIQSLVTFQNAPLFSSLIVFTSVWNRSSAKYGDLAFLHALLEAGHMSENIILVATGLGVGARPMAGFNDDLIHQLLGLDDGEQPIHSIELGKLSAA